jgi:hypothetical protein
VKWHPLATLGDAVSRHTSIRAARTPLRSRHLATHALGGLLGAIIGGAFVLAVTSALKAMIDSLATRPTWVLVVSPLVGLALTTLVLHGVGSLDRRAGGIHGGPFRPVPCAPTSRATS